MYLFLCPLFVLSLALPAVAEETHWAFQPFGDTAVPTVRNEAWPRNEVDRFILARLEAAGIQPAPEADRATLLRRVSYDLTGLPPTPVEMAAFLADESAGAWERVIDRLLASPQYGERWGRHWLDLARYADSSGFHNDLDRPFAWKYRDYVIRSFNDDKPYARFVAEQLAGDEVPGADEDSLIATGFCRNGPSNDDNMGRNPIAMAQYRADQLDDVISTTATVFLGATIGCARCHDHKTDPFTAKDYYSLLAIFNGTHPHGLTPGQAVKPDSIALLARVESKPNPPVTRVMLRGVAANLGEEVPPGIPAVLSSQPLQFPAPAAKSSLRRLTLAEWITAPDNALAWRVWANRIWQHHFGKGIVATPSDFGYTGEKPTHPELLDYLARELVANGGRIKPLHKLILMSATYRQSSQGRAESHASDPANQLLGRMNPRRLEAEAIRDSILAASGKLNLEMGGPGIKPRLRAELIPASQRNKWPQVAREDAGHWRRGVYIYQKRQLLLPMLELFDAPTTTDSCAVRVESVVPTQALVLMNDEFVEEHAGYLAARAMDAGLYVDSVVDRMFTLAFGKSPQEKRRRQAVEFVESRERESSRREALTDLAHVILNSSEFLYVP